MKQLLFSIVGLSFILTAPVMAISEGQEQKIQQNCEKIHEQLVNLQHNDSRTRVYLGRYYETVLTDYITPLNVWLVSNNKSDTGLIENQNNFTLMRASFVSDYVSYQKELEELVATDCESEPGQFYEKLEKVREKRATVAAEVARLRRLMEKQVTMVTSLREGLVVNGKTTGGENE